MKKKKLHLQKKLLLQKQVITALSVTGQGAIQGGSTLCNSLVNEEVCHYTTYPTCTVQPISQLGNISMCNPTELSDLLCQTNTGPNTLQPCCAVAPK